MKTERTSRPLWEIDRRLHALIGAEMRVAAKSFAPVTRNEERPRHFVSVRNLYLPDNSQPAGRPVFFEGRLRCFERQIGVVFVWLDAPTAPDQTAEGAVCFRGQAAILVRGPALVTLANPFWVEPLPADPVNYWRDLQLPTAQFEFPFPSETSRADDSDAPPATPPAASTIPSPERCLPSFDFPRPVAVDRACGPNTGKEEPCGRQPGRNQTRIHNSNCSPPTH